MYCSLYYSLVVNRLSTERRAKILSLMVEGVSLSAISRLTGTSKNSLARLLGEFGSACSAYHNRAVRNVRVRRLQCDEVWSFIGAKAKNTFLGQ
jgi:transposase-like protein